MPDQTKIGFNPEDRFMITLDNTLVVIRHDGRVFGSDIVNNQAAPVFEFGGAKIGFNPQDRFMTAVGNTLVVITSDGSVFGCDILGSGTHRQLAPVREFAGAKIGFNPQDRFLLAVESTLVVVTTDGSVWGSDMTSTPTGTYIGINADGTPMGEIVDRELQPVFRYDGARIGFNPQDRFMVTLGHRLIVVTGQGDAFGASIAARTVTPVIQLNPQPLPTQLQFRLRYFIEHDSTDNFLQGANDEVYLSAVGADSAAVVVGPTGNPAATTTTATSIGDVSSDPVRDPWREKPYVLLDFDLKRPSDWPRSFVVTLLIVEEDNQNLADSIATLEKEVGETIKQAAEAAATAAAGALVGAAIGSIIPGIGTAIGAGVGALAGAGYDLVVKTIKDGLGNDVFRPIPIPLLIDDPNLIRQHPLIGTPHTIDIHELGAWYTIEYDWTLVE